MYIQAVDTKAWDRQKTQPHTTSYMWDTINLIILNYLLLLFMIIIVLGVYVSKY